MSNLPLFNFGDVTAQQPLYETLRRLDPADAYQLMERLQIANRAVIRDTLDHIAAIVRPQLELAPRLAEHFDLDEVATQFAEYVTELNLDTAFVTMHAADRDTMLGRLVDLGNIEVLHAAIDRGPVIALPIHVGPSYGSLVALAHVAPFTTLHHALPFNDIKGAYFPDLDLEGIHVHDGDMVRRCLRALRAGRVLSIFPEISPLGVGKLHEPVPFMDTTVLAPGGTILLAERTGASLVPFVCHRSGEGRYRFHFSEALVPSEDFATRAEGLTRIFAFIEEQLLASEPGKWEMWIEFERMVAPPQAVFDGDRPHLAAAAGG